MFVTWCGGMSIDNVHVQYPADVEEDIQNSIRQLVHNGKSIYVFCFFVRSKKSELKK